MLGLMLGCDFCPTIPKCANDFSFDKIFMIIQSSEDLMKIIKNSSEEEVAKKYMEQFLKGLALITYLPVMKISGNVLPYSEDNAPKNLDKLVGSRLAPGFYEAIFLNKISHNLSHFLWKEKHIGFDSNITKMIETTILKIKKDKGQNNKMIGENSKQSIEVSFINRICPGIIMDKDIDPSIGVLLMLSIHLNQLEYPFIPKLLCLFNQSSISEELKIDIQTLRYYIHLSQLFNSIKELKELIEVMENKDLSKMFEKQPVLFSSSFHESFGETGICGKNNIKFLSQVKEFLKINQGFNPIITDIIEEIGTILKK